VENIGLEGIAKYLWGTIHDIMMTEYGNIEYCTVKMCPALEINSWMGFDLHCTVQFV
jgi:hypothetical protein